MGDGRADQARRPPRVHGNDSAAHRSRLRFPVARGRAGGAAIGSAAGRPDAAMYTIGNARGEGRRRGSVYVDIPPRDVVSSTPRAQSPVLD
ncbi:hypothetical protein E2562_003015 [Oryza meyeriana var. granulata]|uniref:Uncharacterized protein n=1 Tax=Oryza meyeriana var. granulata TaxID=110450 RepID=A0A6G1DDV8_9ORYZ|nr:hypothetical protein E2562_003015 [Oryza meyeriana var. granulata]